MDEQKFLPTRVHRIENHCFQPFNTDIGNCELMINSSKPLKEKKIC
jgi:hypothetical protein